MIPDQDDSKSELIICVFYITYEPKIIRKKRRLIIHCRKFGRPKQTKSSVILHLTLHIFIKASKHILATPFEVRL